jgi:hypothetical protein
VVALRALTFNPRQWLNIIWFLLFLIFIIFGINSLVHSKVPPLWSGDFLAFYATAKIALAKGFSQVYNLDFQRQYQLFLYPQSLLGLRKVNYVTTPMPYLPAFILLFTPFSILSLSTAYNIWFFLNVTLFLLYLFRFTRALGSENGRDILFQLIICIPVVANFMVGQVNVLLMISLGEFFLACQKGKPLQGGFWLSGLLLKPQNLILILPGFFIKKQTKSLLGFLTASLGILVLSLALAGPQALIQWSLLLIGYTQGLPSNSPEVMMNWRALGIHLSNLIPGSLPKILTLAGMIFTGVITLGMWRLPVDSASSQYAVLLLGTLTGTFAVSWHSHMPMLIVVLPLLLFLYARKILSLSMLSVWLFLPPIYYGIVYLISPSHARDLFGLSYLAVNLFFLGWAAQYLHLFSKTFRQRSAFV